MQLHGIHHMSQSTLLRAALIGALLSSLAACGGSTTDSSGTTAAAAVPASVTVVPTAPPVTTGTATTSGSATATTKPSTNGTMLTSTTGQIVDSSLNRWSLKNGVVYEGTAPAGYSANVTSVLYFSGKVYQENSSGGWWVWNGSTWMASTNPQASTAASSSSGSGSSSSSSSSSGGTTTAATGSAAALLKYITSLPGQSKHILSGQHSSYWSSNPMDTEQSAASQTGKTVAIAGITSGDEGSVEDAVALSNAWLAKGGIPFLSWWPSNPWTGVYGGSAVSADQFVQLTQPGSAPYVAWYKLMDQQIAILKSIKGPVMYRPFGEMDGNWSWWGAQNPATMVTVWQQMHTYFVSKGVTNVLWVYNVNSWSGNYTQYYPGAAYVDIVSWDAYPPMPNDPTYPALETLNKPIMLAESGVETPNNNAVAHFSGDNGQLLATVKANFPKVFAISFWCQNWALPVQNGEAAFMNDPAVISMADLPSGLVDP
jgi:hypothetical protein